MCIEDTLKNHSELFAIAKLITYRVVVLYKLTFNKSIIMELDLIKFKTAVLAKEKGFYWDCIYYFNSEGAQYYEFNINNENSREFTADAIYTAPEQELLKRWLRETHNIFVEVSPTFSSGEKIPNNYDVLAFGKHLELIFNTYELALEAGLQYGLGLVKIKKQ